MPITDIISRINNHIHKFWLGNRLQLLVDYQFEDLYLKQISMEREAVQFGQKIDAYICLFSLNGEDIRVKFFNPTQLNAFFIDDNHAPIAIKKGAYISESYYFDELTDGLYNTLDELEFVQLFGNEDYISDLFIELDTELRREKEKQLFNGLKPFLNNLESIKTNSDEKVKLFFKNGLMMEIEEEDWCIYA